MIERILLVTKVVINAIPVAGMILLIPFVKNDYVLTGIYAVIIVLAVVTKRDKKDRIFLAFGFIATLLAETLFIMTGVEKFERNSLFGIMPLWLPLLWAYIFVAIRRAVVALEKYLH